MDTKKWRMYDFDCLPCSYTEIYKISRRVSVKCNCCISLTDYEYFIQQKTFSVFAWPLDYRSGYVNTEKVLYCFYKVILKNTCESKTSQPCLNTLI